MVTPAPGPIIGAVLGSLVAIFLLWSLSKAFIVVREKECIILERLGRFKSVLTPGVHCVVPFLDKPKSFSVRYYVDNARDEPELVEKLNQMRVQTQDEILDLPKQATLTKDGADLQIDVLLSYKVTNAKQMLYNTQNLPRMLSKVLQAQVRAVAGSLDVDSIIEETQSMDRVSSELGEVAVRWGVSINFVRYAKIDAGALSDVLAKRKNADLENQSIIIGAKTVKQKAILESEGQRDRLVKEAEGEAQQMRSRARGEAKAIVNAAQAEADAVREIARAISRTGEDPTRYLLAVKYVEALKAIMAQPATSVKFIPRETAHLQAMQSMGVQPSILSK